MFSCMVASVQHVMLHRIHTHRLKMSLFAFEFVFVKHDQVLDLWLTLYCSRLLKVCTT